MCVSWAEGRGYLNLTLASNRIPVYFLFCVPIDLVDFLSVVEPAPEGDVCQLNQSNNQKLIIESTIYKLELCISFAPFSSFYLNRGWTE